MSLTVTVMVLKMLDTAYYLVSSLCHYDVHCLIVWWASFNQL